jgi:hypothetical protein
MIGTILSTTHALSASRSGSSLSPVCKLSRTTVPEANIQERWYIADVSKEQDHAARRRREQFERLPGLMHSGNPMTMHLFSSS